MIKERIVISDANIFIDLMSIDLLEEFFLLPLEIMTTDFVLTEIVIPAQYEMLQSFVKSRKLSVVSFSYDDVSKISTLQEKSLNNVSMTDCSVWYCAKKNDGRLLTGDAKLRRVAEEDGICVSGILFIFDCLIEYNVLGEKACADKLDNLQKINKRLPDKECKKRIVRWLEC